MKAMRAFSMAAVMLACGAAAHAHHSFAATYNLDETITIEGKMVQFNFRNPHSFVMVEVTDEETGEVVRWGVEWGASTQLRNTGVENDTLRYGDQVVITGNPGRNPGQYRLRMRTVKRPDGFTWGDDADEVFD